MIRIKPDGNGKLTQWDLNRRVMVSGIPDETGFEVHFESREDEHGAYVIPLVFKEGEMYAEVPNILLTYSGIIRVFIFDGNKAVFNWQCPVLGREKPDDYVYTETEVLRFEKLEDEIEKVKELIGPSDWVQNDENALDYVKNRPGAYETVESVEVFHTTIFESQLRQIDTPDADYECIYSWLPDEPNVISPSINENTQNVVATINGTSYPVNVELVESLDNGVRVYGIGVTDDFSKYPFDITFISIPDGDQEVACVEFLNKYDSVDLRITADILTAHKIPAKYLDYIAPDWNESNPDKEGYIAGRPGGYTTQIACYRNPVTMAASEIIGLTYDDIGKEYEVYIDGQFDSVCTAFETNNSQAMVAMIGSVSSFNEYESATDAWRLWYNLNVNYGASFDAKGIYANKSFMILRRVPIDVKIPTKYLNTDDIYNETDSRYIKLKGRSDAFIRDNEESCTIYQYLRDGRYFDNMYIGFMYDKKDDVSYPRIYADSVKGSLIDINGKTHSGSYYGNITEDKHIANKKYVDDQIKNVSAYALNEERGYLTLSRREANGDKTALTGAEVAQIDWSIGSAPLILPYFDASEYGNGYACIRSVLKDEDNSSVTVTMDIFKASSGWVLRTYTDRKYTWGLTSTSGGMISPGTANVFNAESDLSLVVKGDNTIECYKNRKIMTVTDLGSMAQQPAFFRYDRISNTGNAPATWYLGALVWAYTTSEYVTTIHVLPIAEMNNLSENYKYTNKLYNALRTARFTGSSTTQITLSPVSVVSVVTPDYVQSALYMPKINIASGYATIYGLYARNSDSYSILTPAQIVAMKSTRFTAALDGEGIYGGFAYVEISKDTDGTALMTCRVCAVESVRVSIIKIKFSSYETSTSGSVQYPIRTTLVPHVASDSEVIEVLAEAGLIEVLDAVMGTDGSLYEAVLADENGDAIVV